MFVLTMSENASSPVQDSCDLSWFVMRSRTLVDLDGDLDMYCKTYFRSGSFLYVPFEAAKSNSGVSFWVNNYWALRCFDLMKRHGHSLDGRPGDKNWSDIIDMLNDFAISGRKLHAEQQMPWTKWGTSIPWYRKKSFAWLGFRLDCSLPFFSCFINFLFVLPTGENLFSLSSSCFFFFA